MKVGIIGYGVVGSALGKACIAKGMDLHAVYDKYKILDADSPAHMSTPVEECDIVFMCVPTPTAPGNIQDDSAIVENCQLLTDRNFKGTLVVRCTLVPGSCESYSVNFPKLQIAHCPEFLTAAYPVDDLFKQKVALVGSSNDKAREAGRAFWKQFDPRLEVKTFNSATKTELAKYVSNCYLATKVSFLNEIYDACAAASVSYEEVVEAAVSVGYMTAQHTKVPGPDQQRGFGGMCFVKDTTALLGWAKAKGLPTEILSAVTEQNKRLRPQAYDGREATGYKE